MSPFAAVDPDRAQISHRAASMGLASDGHLADVFGMDMIQAATSPTGYTAAQAYYALDQATEAGDFMGARNVGSMSQEEAMGVFGAYVEGYREGLAVADTDTFAGMFSKGRIRRYKKQMERYTAARSANNQKKAARALGRMKALWGRLSESDRQGLTSPDQMAVPGVEVAKAISPKAARIDKKISKDDGESTDAADAEYAAEEAMGAAFGAAGAKAYKNRKAYIEAAIKGRAAGTLSLSALEPLFAAIKAKRGLPTPAEIVEGAEVSLDMVIPAAKKGSSNDMYGADLEVDAEMNAEDVMGAVFGAGGVKQYKHRKAYVEAAMKAIAEGKLGKVNLVALWKKVKGRKGLPSPSEIKAGAEVTADMIVPAAAASSAEAMGADDDYPNRKAYVEAAMKAIAEGKVGKVNLVRLWKYVVRRESLPSPEQIKKGAKVTAAMISLPPGAPAKLGYAFGDDGLPEDDSDIDAVLGADDDEDMDELGSVPMMLIPTASVGHDYPNRKAYVEAAVNAVATGRLGRVNLVRLWKLVRVRKGLPSPAEIKAGSPITMDMALPQLSTSYAFGDDGLPEDDSDIDAVLGADDDEDMDELGFMPGMMLTPTVSSTSTSAPDYLNRKAYVEAAVNAVATGRLGKVNLVKLWKLVKGRKGLPSPAAIKAGAPITMDMVAPSAAMGYAFGDDGLPDDDSDIDAVLGADDDEDMDDLGADDGDDDLDELGAAKGVAIGTRNAYRRNVRDLFRSLRRNKSQYVKKNWGQLKRIWGKLTEDERREVKHLDAILKEAGKVNMEMMILVTGKTEEQIERIGKKKTAESPVSIEAEAEAEASPDYLNRKAYVEAAVNAVSTGRLGKVNLVRLWELVKGRKGLPSPNEIKAGAPITLDMIEPPSAMGYAFGDDDLPEDDSDIDAVLGADDDEDMDDLGADDDDDMDDLGADDDDDMDDLGADEDDDDDFGLDNIEMDLDLDVQRALVNRYSGADQPFPAGGAAPFPGPRMAGHEVF
jgi:hypothetical protein